MIDKRLDDVGIDDIQALVNNEVPEGKSLEYKQTLPGKDDAAKKEFLADVSSFANASGGDLLFGVVEQRDSSGKPTGLPKATSGLSGITADSEIRRMESMIRDGVEPRIPGVHTRAIPGFAEGPVIVVRIPNSWSSPHMVAFKASPRFFSRTSAGKAPLDVAELRAAFLQSESIPERIRQFRDGRLGKVYADETPLPLPRGAKIILHLLPIESFAHPPAMDAATLAQTWAKLRPLNSGSWDGRLNLDGMFTSTNDTDGDCLGYAQLFRTGVIETVDCMLLEPEREGRRLVPAVAYEEELLKSVAQLLELQQGLAITPPIVVQVSLMGVRDYGMNVKRPILRGRNRNRIDRDTLVLPEVVVDDYEHAPDAILRPVFDVVWQSAGFNGSPNFDNDGRWTRNPH